MLDGLVFNSGPDSLTMGFVDGIRAGILFCFETGMSMELHGRHLGYKLIGMLLTRSRKARAIPFPQEPWQLHASDLAVCLFSLAQPQHGINATYESMPRHLARQTGRP